MKHILRLLFLLLLTTLTLEAKVQKVKDSYVSVQTAGETYVGDSLNQTYSINPNLIGSGDTITIIDQGGSNTIELVDGLTISSSVVVHNELLLNLSNGAIVNIRGADTFTFTVGANQISGVVGVEQDFAQFIVNTLGLAAVPTAGQSVQTAGAVTISVHEKTISFIEDSSVNILNPDRGFYDANYNLSEAKNYNMFQSAKDKGYSLVYAPIELNDYNETATLPNDLINVISSHLVDAKDAGVKLILRIKYREGDGNDPDKNIILGHLNQLKTTLVTYKDIISIVQAGTIGAYGEWHSFSGDFADSDENYIANRKEIIEKLSEIFPNKYIQIRTPMHKELLFGASQEYKDIADDAKISADIAFSEDIKAKIAHHNDCFLASETDMGTYPSSSIEFWQNYIINDTKYAPVGGETCKDEVEFTTCNNARSELKRFQYSYINEAYHPDVITRWKNEGCYQDIKENIGYRFVATLLTLEEKSDALNISLSIDNKGYASPYIKSNVRFILKNDTNSYEYEPSNIDLRTFNPQELNKIEDSLNISEVVAGEYCLYIQIGEEYSSIRLSNSGLWDDELKSNKLSCDIVVE